MSDFEDEMDVDVQPSKDAIQFSSDKSSGKTKRLTADLPVEAEDNLPWWVANVLTLSATTDHPRVEKYRPNTLEDVSGHQDILATINKFVDANVCSSMSVNVIST